MDANDSKTASDAKLEPKVTLEQAMKVLQPKVEALLKETLAGFEVAEGDKRSKKRIFGALVTAAAGYMATTEKLSLGSLGRRCNRAVGSLYPKSVPEVDNTDDDGGDSGEGDVGDDD